MEKGAAEPGRGVSVGLNAKANIYNNVMVDNYQGLEIFTDADTVNTHYGNNLLYASIDAYSDTTVTPKVSIPLRSNFYPGDGVGKPGQVILFLQPLATTTQCLQFWW